MTYTPMQKKYIEAIGKGDDHVSAALAIIGDLDVNESCNTQSVFPYGEAKKIATSFYYWWHNHSGTNTQQGFDEWWKQYKPSRMVIQIFLKNILMDQLSTLTARCRSLRGGSRRSMETCCNYAT